MNKYYTLEELENMPTLHQGHCDNVKYDDGKTRVLLSRMTIEDGMEYNNQVTIEKLKREGWVTVAQYQAK